MTSNEVTKHSLRRIIPDWFIRTFVSFNKLQTRNKCWAAEFYSSFSSACATFKSTCFTIQNIASSFINTTMIRVDVLMIMKILLVEYQQCRWKHCSSDHNFISNITPSFRCENPYRPIDLFPIHHIYSIYSDNIFNTLN